MRRGETKRNRQKRIPAAVQRALLSVLLAAMLLPILPATQAHAATPPPNITGTFTIDPWFSSGPTYTGDFPGSLYLDGGYKIVSYGDNIDGNNGRFFCISPGAANWGDPSNGNNRTGRVSATFDHSWEWAGIAWYWVTRIAPDNPWGVQDLGAGWIGIGWDFTKGTISLEKSSGNPSITDGNPCYSLAGAIYDVYDDGWTWVGSITTDNWGKGSLGGLDLGTYYVKEVKAPPGYSLDPTTHTVTTSHDSPVQTVYSTDQPNGDPFLVMLQKVDAETGGTYGAGELPQGSGSLAGAEFTVKYYQGLYYSVGDAQAVTPTRTWIIGTDNNGYATLDVTFIGGDPLYYDDYGFVTIPFGTITIVETKAPNGYRLPQLGDVNYKVFLTRYVPDASQPHGVRIEGDGNGVEQGNEPKQREPVIRGDIEITKYVKDHKDDSAIETGTHTPESGIIFDFYASRDFTGTTPNPGKVPAFSLTTDAAGFASTKGMYLIQNQDGTYTLQPRPATASGALPADSYLCVQQTSWTGWEKCDPFIYTVGNNGVTIPAVRYDPVIPAAIRIVKLDVETGREVPYPASWQIYSEQTRSFVKMQVGTTTTDIFSSDASGQLLLPEQLPYGSYQLREHTAPWGYILNKQVVKFSVLDRHDFDAPLVISFLDAPAKGTISIHKVAAPTKTDLKGATYAIIAAVDIYTPDGTLRHAKDTTVASITTGGAGRATSGPLYLGSYIVKETTAPDGYQLDKTEYPVVLVYAGQTVELVREQLELVDKEVGVEAFKYDLDTRQPVPDTEFKLWRENLPVSGSWVLVGTQVSGADGKVVFKPVVRGSYKLVESRPNPLYASCEASGQPGTQYFTIDEDSTTVVLKYYNKKLIRGDIEIKKYIAEHKPDSAEPSGIVSPEAFVTFDFYASRDFVGLMPKRGKAPAFSLTTDIAGYASTITADIYLTQNSDGTYTITKRPAVTDGGLPADTYLCVQRDGYPEYDKAAPFVLAIDSLGIIRSKTIYDQPVSAFIRVVKLDSQTGREVFYPASWQIYSKQTKSYVKMKLGASMTDTFTSDAKGKLVLPEPLPYGDYLLHEAAAPHRDGRGYLANTTDLPFSVTQSTSASTPLVVIMKDDPAKGQITLEKRDAVCDEPVEGAVYTIFANEDIYTLDGTLHWADGDEVASITTDADGKAASGPLHLGKYIVKETSRPDGYHMDLDTHAVSLEYADQTTALVLVRLELTDEPQKVTGEKKDKDTDAPVPNTEFTLYKESALGAKDWVEVGVLVTDQDGKVTFSPVIAGSYKLVETKPNPNYASCEESGEMGTHYFVIDENSTDEVQVFYNKKIQLACETYKDTINITSAAFKTFDEDHVQINNIGTETYEYLLGFRSLANVRADEYTVVDEMENAQFGQVALVSLTTPVPYGDSDGRFNLWYRTNMTDPGTLYSDVNALVDNPANPLNPHNEPMRSSLGWQLWAQGLPTTSPTTLAVSALGLQDGEYITGVRYEYGSVEVGFATDDGAIGFTQVDKAGLYWTPPAAASEGEARSVPNGGEREDVGTDEGVETQATGLAPASSPVVSQPARYEVAAQHAILPPEDIRSSVNVFIARNLTLTDTDQDAVVTTVVEPFMVTPAEEVPYPSSRDSQIPNKLPQTGDQLTLLLLSLAAVLAGMGIVVLVVKKVRDRKRRAGVAGEVARGAADGEVAGEVASGVTGGAKSDAMDEVADEMDPGQ